MPSELEAAIMTKTECAKKKVGAKNDRAAGGRSSSGQKASTAQKSSVVGKGCKCGFPVDQLLPDSVPDGMCPIMSCDCYFLDNDELEDHLRDKHPAYFSCLDALWGAKDAGSR